METLIKTSDMPDVHRVDNGGVEVVPSTKISTKVPSHDLIKDYSYETNTLLHLDPEYIVKRLHSSYNDFINAVDKSFETCAGILWDTYQKFIKLKAANPTTYDKAICELENINDKSVYSVFYTKHRNLTNNKELLAELTQKDKKSNVDDSDKYAFRRFILNILQSNQNCDIPALINYKKYIDEVAKLRYELQHIDSNFKFDIENCAEYTAHSKDLYNETSKLNSLAFKVKPRINKISNSVTNSIYDYIPTYDFKICIDIHKLIIWMVSNCTLPDEFNESMDSIEHVREEYVKSVLGEYTSFSEIFARRMVTEVYDMHYNIMGNWGRFLKKFIYTYNKLIANPNVINIINKANYFANLSNSHNDSNMIKEYVSTNTELFEKIFTNINERWNFDDTFTNQMFVTVSDSSLTGSELLINQATVLFRKTFSVFFENAVLLNFRRIYQEEHYSKGIKIASYIREFHKAYDITDLLNKTAAITDLNTRDFMQNLLSEFKSVEFGIYDNTKLSNGEYMFFTYSKLSRLIWMEITNNVILASRLTTMIERTKPRNENDRNLHERIKKTILRFSESIYSILTSMFTETRIVPSKRSIGVYREDIDSLLLDHLDFCYKYSRFSTSSFDDNNIELSKLINSVLNKENEKRISDGFISSYDVSEQDITTIGRNFITLLKQRGMVDVDF